MELVAMELSVDLNEVKYAHPRSGLTVVMC